MIYKALQSVKKIHSHGPLEGVNPTSVSKEMERWSK